MNDETPPREGRPGYEVVAEQILELLSAENLKSGDYVGTELEIAQRLSASRTVVREAVKTLSALGRVRSRKGKGVFVGDAVSMTGLDFFLPGDLEHVDMLFEFRQVQEEAAARFAALRATPQAVRAVQEAADESAQQAAGDATAFFRADNDFHDALMDAARNRFVASAAKLARSLQRQSGLLFVRDATSDALQRGGREHLSIAGAISAGDPDASVAAVHEHLESTRSQYEQMIKG